MAEEEKKFVWKIVRWTLGVFSTVMAAAIISLISTASSVVFDVYDLKQDTKAIEERIDINQSIMIDRIIKNEQMIETMRREWREDQKEILNKLDKLNDKISK